jgi:uncharacterized membrane protein YphA (DoxX/SURF4 family)
LDGGEARWYKITKTFTKMEHPYRTTALSPEAPKMQLVVPRPHWQLDGDTTIMYRRLGVVAGVVAVSVALGLALESTAVGFVVVCLGTVFLFWDQRRFLAKGYSATFALQANALLLFTSEGTRRVPLADVLGIAINDDSDGFFNGTGPAIDEARAMLRLGQNRLLLRTRTGPIRVFRWQLLRSDLVECAAKATQFLETHGWVLPPVSGEFEDDDDVD